MNTLWIFLITTFIHLIFLNLIKKLYLQIKDFFEIRFQFLFETLFNSKKIFVLPDKNVSD